MSRSRILSALGLSAAAMRAPLMVNEATKVSGKAWSNSNEARTFSKASWITPRSTGRWSVSDTLFVPGTRMTSVSAGHVTGCGTPAVVMFCTLPPPPSWDRLPVLAVDKTVVGGVVLGVETGSCHDGVCRSSYEFEYKMKEKYAPRPPFLLAWRRLSRRGPQVAPQASQPGSLFQRRCRCRRRHWTRKDRFLCRGERGHVQRGEGKRTTLKKTCKS
jgi:hypothetical protein